MSVLLLMQLTLVLASPTLSFSSASSSTVPAVVRLLPEISFTSQHALYGVPHLFRVVELKPSTVYDIKVSYPATQPSLFTLQVERVLLPLPVASNDDLEAGNANIGRNVVKSESMPPRRRVLNTAILRLHPDEVESHESVRYRLEPSYTAVEVEFSLLAEMEGVQRADSKLKMEKCVFDIVVEEVLLEAFPRDTLLLIGWLMVLLVVSGKWVLPYLERKIALGCVEDRVELTQTKKS